MWHQRVTDKDNEMDWVLRTPTYTTAGNLEVGHKSEVVTLRVLSKIKNDDFDRVSNKFLPIQVSGFLNSNIYFYFILFPQYYFIFGFSFAYHFSCKKDRRLFKSFKLKRSVYNFN